jgi:hypothetical protein
MSGKPIPSFDEFRECVLAAYAPLVRTMGFVELPRRKNEGCEQARRGIGERDDECDGAESGPAGLAPAAWP